MKGLIPGLDMSKAENDNYKTAWMNVGTTSVILLATAYVFLGEDRCWEVLKNNWNWVAGPACIALAYGAWRYKYWALKDKTSKQLEKVYLANALFDKKDKTKLMPSLIDKHQNKLYSEYVYNPLLSKNSDDFQAICKTASEILNKQVEAEYDKKTIKIRVFSAELGTNIPFEVLKLKDMNMGVYLGHSRYGPEFYDLDGNGSHHMSFHGETGEGKTVATEDNVLLWLLNYPTDYFRIMWADCKMTDSKAFRRWGIPNIQIYNEFSAVIGMLNDIYDEIERRKNIMDEVDDCSNLREYNQQVPPEKRLPYVLVILDDYVNLAKASPQIDELTIKIGTIARAFGIHLIVNVQRATRDFIHPGVKVNLGVRVSFRTNGEIYSRNFLGEDHPEAHKIKYKGRAFISTNEKFSEVQFMHPTHQDIKQVLTELGYQKHKAGDQDAELYS